MKGTNLLMSVVAIMVLFPRMVKIIVEGLLPISEAAKSFFNKRFKGKEVFIGLDSAITLGLPTTQIVGKEIIAYARQKGVVVEAEIGHVGSGENYENLEQTESLLTTVNWSYGREFE